MEYSKIVAITGLPGLFELINSKTDGAIVRSLEDKSTRFVSSRIHNFSHLESIEVFTTGENVNLAEILKAMEASAEQLPSEKDAAAITRYFRSAYPKLDFDRVYNSDLRKMVKWYTVLRNNQVDFSTPTPEALPEKEQEEKKPRVEKPAVQEPPVPTVEKSAKKKKEEPKAEAKKTEKKPVKAKPVKKEKKEDKEKTAAKKEKPAKKAAKKKK